MLGRPELKSCCRVEVLDDQHVVLLAERDRHLLTGAAFGPLVRLLDGSRTVEELVETAVEQGRVSAPEVCYCLDRLEALGCIREGQSALPRPAAAFWDSLAADTAGAAERLGSAKVAIVGVAGIAPGPLAAAMAALGVAVVPASEAADLAVVLVDDYLRPELAEINRGCLRDGRPWLLARPAGTILWLGPLLHPGRTGCWECLAQRLRSNRALESHLQARRGSSQPPLTPPAALASGELAAVGLLATELAKLIVRAPSFRLEGALVTLDLATLQTERHLLARRPQCRACGDGEAWAARAPRPVRLASRRKQHAADGGHREVSPEETLRRYESQVSPLLGVVRELRRAPGLDGDSVQLYWAGHNAALNQDALYLLRNNFRSACGGKGKTDAQARASALCEAIERYSGVFQGDEVRIRGSLRSLGPAAIHPNACMNFSAAQYARREEWNAAAGMELRKVPRPFDEEAEIEWCPLWSLTEQRFKHLPTAFCYYAHPVPVGEEPFCWSDSNGNAAGNSLEEAILQGFLELVERDSVAIWWFNRLTRPGVDLDSFEEPYFRRLRDYYRSLGRELWVLDITADLGIPAFAAMTRRTGTASEDITMGFGAHLDARLGILRAVTEVNQSLPMVLPRHADPNAPFATDDEEALAWLRTSRLDNRGYLAAAPGAPRSAADYPPASDDDLDQEVLRCVRIAAEHGLETLVLDQTRPDIGLPVVKVVVPGLRHFWTRFGPGRLYDVPVALGWRAAPLAERDLNPIQVFF
jgi:bacteriocin biosynthesis cyclodehydratase domain-containing protein